MHSVWVTYRNAPLAWVQDSLGCALSPPGGRHLSRTGLSCGLNDSIVKVLISLTTANDWRGEIGCVIVKASCLTCEPTYMIVPNLARTCDSWVIVSGTYGADKARSPFDTISRPRIRGQWGEWCAEIQLAHCVRSVSVEI